MVSKNIIYKVINDITIKCGLKYFSKTDEAFVDQFDPNDYVEGTNDPSNNKTDLFNKQSDVQKEVDFIEKEMEYGGKWSKTFFKQINGFIYKTKYYKKKIKE